jgi:hypothetical protein
MITKYAETSGKLSHCFGSCHENHEVTDWRRLTPHLCSKPPWNDAKLQKLDQPGFDIFGGSSTLHAAEIIPLTLHVRAACWGVVAQPLSHRARGTLDTARQ